MAKLYFKYGVMGSSKSAQALITKFNYEERGMSVWLIKPSIDTRDGADIIRSSHGYPKPHNACLFSVSKDSGPWGVPAPPDDGRSIRGPGCDSPGFSAPDSGRRSGPWSACR